MVTPTRTPLGASTNNRKWWLDVAAADTPTVFVGVFGLKEFKPKTAESSQQDNADWEGEGWGSSVTTGLKFGAEGKLQRKTQASDATAYDPGQELLRVAARGMGQAGRIRVRIYEMEPDGPRVEAYEAWASVTWDEDGGDQEALDTVSFKLMGQGKPDLITHPDATPAVPVILSFLDGGIPAGDGDQLIVTGLNFDITKLVGTDPAYVKVAGVNAAYEVLSAEVVSLIMPTGDDGPVVVAIGTATDTYTRGA